MVLLLAATDGALGAGGAGAGGVLGLAGLAGLGLGTGVAGGADVGLGVAGCGDFVAVGELAALCGLGSLSGFLLGEELFAGGYPEVAAEVAQAVVDAVLGDRKSVV